MSEEKPDDKDLDLSLEEQETLRMGPALAILVELEGWRIVLELQERAANEIGREFLRDGAMTKDYARGYLHATEAVRKRVEKIIANCRDVQAEHSETAAVAFASGRIGGGSLAGA